jgi:hypothetical protein
VRTRPPAGPAPAWRFPGTRICTFWQHRPPWATRSRFQSLHFNPCATHNIGRRSSKTRRNGVWIKALQQFWTARSPTSAGTQDEEATGSAPNAVVQ